MITQSISLSRHSHPYSKQRGSALVEYIVVALFVVLVLMAVGPDGIQQLMTNLRQAYSAFVYAISASWI